MGGSGVAHGGVDSSNHVGEEVTVNVSCSNGSTFSVQVHLDSTVEIFKSVLAQKCEIPIQQQRVIYRGRILKSDQTLKSYGLEAGHTVHLVRSSATETAASTDAGVRSFFPGLDAGFDEGGPLGPGFLSTFFPGIERSGIRNFSDIYEHVMQQFDQNPNLVSDIFNIPSVQNIMNNPETIRNSILRNPQIREIMDRNPGVVDIFNDPMNFRQTMDAARDPEIVRVVMGNTGRAMNNTPAPIVNPLPNRSTSAGTGGTQTNLDTHSSSTENFLGLNPQLLNMANSNPAHFIHHLSSTGILQQPISALSSQLGRQTSPEPGQNAAEGTAGTADNILLDMLMDMIGGLTTDDRTITPNRSQVPPEELYAAQLSQLREMGFIDTYENIRALIAVSGNVNAAVDRVTANPAQ